MRIEARWADGDDGRLHKLAAELVAITPDVILTSGSVTVRPLQQATFADPCSPDKTITGYGPRLRRHASAQATTSTKSASVLTLKLTSRDR
jgi:hypothetical protein